jgi:isonocardicin synthase
MSQIATTMLTLMVGFDERPYNVFVISIGQRRFFGWKEPVAFRCDDPAPATRSCLVAFSDVIGELEAWHATDAGYRLSYHAISGDEVAALVHADLHDTELTYPFRRLLDGQETVQTEAYWSARAAAPDGLDDDEWFMRDAAVQLLSPVLQPGDLVFDPACSTGRFLAALGTAMPQCRLRGQELSEPMARLARTRLDDVRIGSAASPACGDGEARALICRFLNLDVVTSSQALQLFDRLCQCVAPGGYLLVLGHTPVLLNQAAMQADGFVLRQSVQLTPDRHALYQFYLLQKPA